MNKTTEALKLAEEALNAMLTHMGMDEDEWTKPTFNQAREALAAIRKSRAEQEPVAVISESAIGLVKLHSNGACLPFGTQLYAAPVKREWVELEPSQLCEIEERIGLPIDSHDFETIGNAYIAAFKEKNE